MNVGTPMPLFCNLISMAFLLFGNPATTQPSDFQELLDKQNDRSDVRSNWELGRNQENVLQEALRKELWGGVEVTLADVCVDAFGELRITAILSNKGTEPKTIFEAGFHQEPLKQIVFAKQQDRNQEYRLVYSRHRKKQYSHVQSIGKTLEPNRTLYIQFTTKLGDYEDRHVHVKASFLDTKETEFRNLPPPGIYLVTIPNGLYDPGSKNTLIVRVRENTIETLDLQKTSAEADDQSKNTLDENQKTENLSPTSSNEPVTDSGD
ncbi:MAG: hypothetical protein MI923_03515 [Phycisphaerales bacterium]|nr:hypothetical protein [Phycisphaerales bacterium]